MRVLEYIPSSWRLIKRNRLRSFLTMLGIIIGVMSVVVIMSVGAGAQSLILNQVKSLGSNLVGVLPGKSDDNGPPAAVFGVVVTTLKTADMDAILSQGNPHVIAATSYVRGADTVTSGEAEADTSFVGVNSSYPDVESITVESGRFFTKEEENSLAKVAILGSETAADLFDTTDPIGQNVKIKKTNFTVIGVLKKRGVSGFQNQDAQIFVPVSTAQKLLLGIDHVSFMRFKIDDAAYIDSSVDYMKDVLRDQHNISNPENDDFTIRSANQGLDALTGITNALRFFLAAIAAISLVVGGIGIMNIMLAAVEERTKEIGLRKALGAQEKDISAQFLIETIMITLTGGVIGISLGIFISVSVANVARELGYSWDLVISPWSIFLGCAVSFAIGLAFGLSPAKRAAKLNPIEALRYE